MKHELLGWIAFAAFAGSALAAAPKSTPEPPNVSPSPPGAGVFIIEPADGAKRRPPVLKTGGPTRYPDASGGEPYQVLRYAGQLQVQRCTLTFEMKKSISPNGRLLSRQP